VTESRPTASELRDLMRGVFVIVIWYEDDGTEVGPPLASGRFVLVDGQVVSLLFKTNADGTTQTQALFGRYEIEDGAFSYGYDVGQQITKSPDGTTELIDVGSGQLNRFVATRESDHVLLRTNDERLGFRVTPGVIQFVDNGHLRRRWERVEP
jgi:hypothetical protein